MKTSVKSLTFSQRFEKYIFEKGLSEDEMFKCLNILIDYGGVKRVSDFAKENNKSATIYNVPQPQLKPPPPQNKS